MENDRRSLGITEQVTDQQTVVLPHSGTIVFRERALRIHDPELEVADKGKRKGNFAVVQVRIPVNPPLEAGS